MPSFFVFPFTSLHFWYVCVVERHGDLPPLVGIRTIQEQLHEGRGVHAGVVGDGDNLLGDPVECLQHVVSLSAEERPHEPPGDPPDRSEEVTAIV